jgi:acyl-coenzyme A thioesterase PaaI-like protein
MPIRKDTGRIRCVANIAGRGNQIMSAEARLEDPAGELLAHGTSTIMVLGARR